MSDTWDASKESRVVTTRHGDPNPNQIGPDGKPLNTTSESRRIIIMARPKKENTNAPDSPDDGLVEGFEQPEESRPEVHDALPYALVKELGAIMETTGNKIDLNRPIEELEAICNKANYPPNAWRGRWAK